MSAEHPSDKQLPIRRGQGLRLSVTSPDADIPTPEASDETLRRGQGLRLSTHDSPAAPSTLLRELIGAPQVVELSHAPLAYRAAGHGPPLILLHGWAASSRYWLITLAALSADFRVYALDLPGFGDSPALPEPGTVARQAQTVLEFADALGLATFDINGHSYGGAVAVALAAAQPQRVRRLVITALGVIGDEFERLIFATARAPLDLTLRLGYPWLNLIAPWVELWRPFATALLCIPPLPQMMAARFIENGLREKWMLQEGIVDLTKMDLRAHLMSMASVGDPQVFDAFRAAPQPTLLIGGVGDKIMPPEALRAAAQTMRQARLAFIEQCGHIPMIEQPEAYHAALRSFLVEG
ncbi:alpha/beta fold hydrolase [Roseiflexus sp.]|uniref:alpha/beta fold hydrolase n=1 Tax=Roseiflexus sp. TaxID=2562120 RepID=UPI0021DCDF5C|nr:alpha/beta hydrolase [Roseiflexus sp.]GIW01403.1 MAG: alpha/beta hydrolase [Roseiflexus sp.]